LNRLPLHKLIWMIAALAASILFAPVTASAHEGHPAVTSALHASAHHAAAKADTVTIAAIHSSFAAVAPGSDDLSGLTDPCTGGCCFGMGCCAATAASDLPSIEPPTGTPMRVASPSPDARSAGSGSLLEPPTTHA
jgi:hypothetical protein